MISLRDVVTGFGVRDPLADVWRRSLRGGGDGAAEITGVPPLRYIGDGRPLTDYRIAGNTLQDGTPSPDAPVDVVGCGVRTGNLWDEEYPNISATIIYIPLYVGEGSFTLSTTTPYDSGVANLFLLGGNVSSGASTPGNGAWLNHNVTAQSDSGYITIAYRHYSGTTSPANRKTMLNLGSTALPYEPYGYKLPPTVNSTEHPIYLGTVPTTRWVKKLVFDGSEPWYFSSMDSNRIVCRLSHLIGTNAVGYCTHIYWKSSYEERDYNRIVYTDRFEGGTLYMSLENSILSGQTVAAFKSYLAQQYANGTPVTVWYVLAEPETAIVNEPLMKIGGYADTISFAQAGVTIPTVNGENILTVPMTVPPSEITIKGGISSV